jgi:tripartite-type tricarboxylate transporter receptor subunit TctC
MTQTPPLRLLVGFSARSASDDLAQALAPELARTLGRPVQIDLMPGEAGAKAARVTATSPPDGTMLMLATFGTHAINPNIRADLGYDPLADFTPVSLATRSPLILGVHPAVPADSLADLIALAARTRLTYGSSSTASAPYLAAAMLQKRAGVTMAHVPYADTRVLYEDLIAGRLDLSINNVMTMLPLVQGGQVRALAVTTAARLAALPDTPTVAEAGLDGYAVSNWLGFVAPPGTAPAIIAAQNQAIAGALRAPAMRDMLAASGIETVASSPASFARHIAAERDLWSWIGPHVAGAA